MAPSSAIAHRSEVQVSKSPAEFFAENQAIAGFDNYGKSLYTTIRELVENSLDACESVQVLPDISVCIEEMTQHEFNVVRGLTKKDGKSALERKDMGLFATKKKKGRKSTEPEHATKEDAAAGTVAAVQSTEAPSKTAAGKKKKSAAEGYFRIKVQDNGCGMSHDAIPNLLGRVLSGSKYGVRQTRGKFGLGAKMALIWSKKSTGVPIEIQTAHMATPGVVGAHISKCILDIDIYKNRPRIIEHSKRPNTEQWVGTEFSVIIMGNWPTYKARIVQYLQQLAIITPYARLEMTYQNVSEEKRNMTIRYDRRSEQMPDPAKEVKHHPSSVNNLLISQLLERTRAKTFAKFLCTELSSVSPALAKRLIAELGFDESMHPSGVGDKQVTRLVQLLRSVELFKAPDGSCLSPLGEYNLNLGIRKVLQPDMVATARDKPSAYEGHPFIVEAAVSIGGKDVKEGITVVRFANRIPLLFEGGADVATRVAQTKIRWTNYKIDMKRDRIGVFVSIVSTKVPFKGTGKEYIGDDITEIQVSVKRALQSCCQQLRTHLAKKHALKDIRERKSRLIKYVPDVSRAIYGLLDGMRKRKQEEGSPNKTNGDAKRSKRITLDDRDSRDMIRLLDRNEITEEVIKKRLVETIEAQGVSAEQLEASSSQGALAQKGKRKRGDPIGGAQPLFLLCVPNLESSKNDIDHPLFRFRPLKPVENG